MPENDIELEDIKTGQTVTVPRAHWLRYPQLAQSFRPVSEKKTTPVVATPAPTGQNKEN